MREKADESQRTRFWSALDHAFNEQLKSLPVLKLKSERAKRLNLGKRTYLSVKVLTQDNRLVVEFRTDGPKADLYYRQLLEQQSEINAQLGGLPKGLKHKNVAAELLQKLLKDEIKQRSRRNVVQSRMFSEMLQQTLNGYHNRAIATQEVIDELINLTKEMQKANQRGEDLGLGEDEICFYDALAQSESAVEAMGIDELKVIAAELVTKVRSSVTIDWQHRETARARIRIMVRRILRRFGYPPDLQAEATKLVLKQAEVLCADWLT